MSGVKV